MSLFVVTHDRQRIGRRNVPTRPNIWRRALGRNPENELDLADAGRKTGGATHKSKIAPTGRWTKLAMVPASAQIQSDDSADPRDAEVYRCGIEPGQ